ncbi:hypothetical protein BDW69DRAFT_155420 [Aspergillus filifer]
MNSYKIIRTVRANAQPACPSLYESVLDLNYQVMVGHFFGTLGGVELDNWLALFYILQPVHATEAWKDNVMHRIRSGSVAPSGLEGLEQAPEIPQSIDPSGLNTCVMERLTTVDGIDALREIMGTLMSHGNVPLVREASLIALHSDVPFYLIVDGQKNKSECEIW